MSDTLFHLSSQSRYPYWINMPPRVPHYPNMEDMLRTHPIGRFTVRPRKNSHQNWVNKLYDVGHGVPQRDKLPKPADSHQVGWFRWQFQPGTSAVPVWTRAGKDWPGNKNFQTAGKSMTELMRHRANYRVHDQPPSFYSRSNYMTSTYRQPILSVSGPLQRDKCYGLTHQHKRHGFMTYEDYY